MASKKCDIVTFRGKYCDSTVQVDRDLKPFSTERRGVLDDALNEWDSYSDHVKTREEKRNREDQKRGDGYNEE